MDITQIYSLAAIQPAVGALFGPAVEPPAGYKLLRFRVARTPHGVALEVIWTPVI
jgi:hypothetical protein